MRQNRPADLEWLYPDGRLNRSAKAARRWVEVLTDWRRQRQALRSELASTAIELAATALNIRSE